MVAWWVVIFNECRIVAPGSSSSSHNLRAPPNVYPFNETSRCVGLKKEFDRMYALQSSVAATPPLPYCTFFPTRQGKRPYLSVPEYLLITVVS